MLVASLKRTLFFLLVSLTIVLTIGETRPALGQAAKAKTKAADKAKLDLNKATAKELETELPGVGEVTAKKIVEGRPYSSIDDLAKAGLSAKTIDAIRPLVTITAAPTAKAAPAKKTTTKSAAAAKSANDATGEKVNVNTASLKELEELPGIGPALAQQIIDARPLKTIDDLDKVKGMGKVKIAAIKDLVVFSDATPPTTKTAEPPATSKPVMTKKGVAKKAITAPAPGKLVNINTASKEELDALPGIGPVKAQAIVDGRPFKTKEDIMKVKGIKEGEFGKIKDMITVD